MFVRFLLCFVTSIAIPCCLPCIHSTIYINQTYLASMITFVMLYHPFLMLFHSFSPPTNNNPSDHPILLDLDDKMVDVVFENTILVFDKIWNCNHLWIYYHNIRMILVMCIYLVQCVLYCYCYCCRLYRYHHDDVKRMVRMIMVLGMESTGPVDLGIRARHRKCCPNLDDDPIHHRLLQHWQHHQHHHLLQLRSRLALPLSYWSQLLCHASSAAVVEFSLCQ
mmetsp:Transcript_8241/g.23703  ORF Transcript_8241/g.23703 Transcript_8241/m.23703 type:complete len:222 (+) Transcript_8241:35-700(+)